MIKTTNKFNFINIFRKKTTRWTSGNSRNWQTTLFNQQIKRKISGLILKSFLTDKNKKKSDKYQFQQKVKQLNSKSLQYKPKNFCLILGKNRTYNRKLFISRQILRKLMRNNAVTSIMK